MANQAADTNVHDPRQHQTTELSRKVHYFHITLEAVVNTPENLKLRMPNVAGLFPDPYSLPELFLAGEYFWDSEFPPEPLFMDGIKIQKPFPNQNEPEDFSFNLNEDFDATPWDVDDFFEPD
ncbi:hypothetical protein DY000_02013931 [Brassica cretica]|uniref:AGC-kinase C-terminal domain-containing protein n=1 Tax=Brassica cretica TaxID=69181 RepID=A0ABQ7CN92_BRACR|nr:hypothetical protein DY000_02013931 [Brassica cretica]